MTENREIKSSIFADLFCDDEKDGKKNFLSLFNAIHGTELKLEDTHLEARRINQAIYKTFNNDISMIVNGRLIVLIEHQSTPNANMPLRFLEYYVHLLYGLIPHEARYKEKIYKIPTPEFYVFYNGEKKIEREITLRLSDAFLEPQKSPMCEVMVKFTNIKGIDGSDSSGNPSENLPILQKCDILRQYQQFMEIIFRYQAELKQKPTSEEAQNCYEKALKESISKDILADYLTRKGSEVINMFIGEYDYDTDIRVKTEEAREDGLAIGAQQKAVEAATNLLKMNILTIEQISQATKLSVEEVTKLAKEA